MGSKCDPVDQPAERGETISRRSFADAEFGAPAPSENGNVAIRTVKGLAIRDRNRWKVLGTKSGLPMDSVSSFFVDRGGSPLIGTNGGGAARWLGFGAWENWTAPAWLEDDAIWSIAEDHSGDIWVGSNTGIMKMTQGGQAMQAPARNRLRFGERRCSLNGGRRIKRSMGRHPASWLDFIAISASEHCDPVGEESGLHSPSVSRLALDKRNFVGDERGRNVFGKRYWNYESTSNRCTWTDYRRASIPGRLS